MSLYRPLSNTKGCVSLPGWTVYGSYRHITNRGVGAVVPQAASNRHSLPTTQALKRPTAPTTPTNILAALTACPTMTPTATTNVGRVWDHHTCRGTPCHPSRSRTWVTWFWSHGWRACPGTGGCRAQHAWWWRQRARCSCAGTMRAGSCWRPPPPCCATWQAPAPPPCWPPAPPWPPWPWHQAGPRRLSPWWRRWRGGTCAHTARSTTLT
mmetsp:Transcript_33802/g.74918  ORF Transcript_33802/g.74918 Transcript_33802/m.74918 type:complete len:210 (+) Transcript_33802:1752-2381(+)